MVRMVGSAMRTSSEPLDLLTATMSFDHAKSGFAAHYDRRAKLHLTCDKYLCVIISHNIRSYLYTEWENENILFGYGV